MKIIDIHVYYGKWPWPIKMGSREDILEVMKTYDVEKCILVSTRSINHDFVGGNKELATDIEGYPQLLGYVFVSPHYPEISLKEMDKYLGQKNFAGIKYHPEYSNVPVNAKQNRTILDHLRKFKKPLIVHTYDLPVSRPVHVLEIAGNYPSLKIVMGHMGGPGWQEAIDAASQVNNLWLDPCCSWAQRDKIACAVHTLGAEKIIFGSGMTENNFTFTVGMIRDAGITDSEKEKIFYYNAKEVFDI